MEQSKYCEETCGTPEFQLRRKTNDFSVFERKIVYEDWKGGAKHPKMLQDYPIQEYALRKFKRTESTSTKILPRSMEALETSVNHIVNNSIDADRLDKCPCVIHTNCPGHSFMQMYSFASDRFRAIHQELRMHNHRPDPSKHFHVMLTYSMKNVITQHIFDFHVQFLEIMVRFFILSIHDGYRDREEDEKNEFSGKNNHKLLGDALQTWNEIRRSTEVSLQSYKLNNRAEFLAYTILHNLHETTIVNRLLMELQEPDFDHPKIKLTMDVLEAISMENYIKFFRILKSCNDPFLLCLLIPFVDNMRINVLKIQRNAFRMNASPTIKLIELGETLCFENTAVFVEYILQFGTYFVKKTPDAPKEDLYVDYKAWDQSTLDNYTNKTWHCDSLHHIIRPKLESSTRRALIESKNP